MSQGKVETSPVEPLIYSRDVHSISRKDIDADALKIMYRLLHHGYKAYLVGGGVRDLLLRKRPKDFDIATDATPRRIKSLFRNSRIIGRRFKLVHVFFHSNKIIEVSTFRDTSDPIDIQEVEEGEDSLLIVNDNKYGTERTDAIRRDITINALFYDLATFSVIDYVGGVEDLKNGVVQIIGDPDVRFAEDPVRLIRVVRHAVRAGFIVEEACYQALIRNSMLILQSSPVRVYEELKKDLVSGYALGILQLLCKTGLLQYLIPSLSGEMAALILDDPELMRSLGMSDQLIREGRSVSHTVVLGIIAVFVSRAAFQTVSLLEPFTNGERCQELVKQCFEKFSVPRKERERIESMLNQWSRLMRTPAEALRASSLARRVDVEDILSLCLCLPESPEGSHVIATLEEACERRHHGERGDGQQQRRQRGQGRGRSRHPRRRRRNFI